MEMIHDYAEGRKKTSHYRNQRNDPNDERFSLDLDEWTNERRRKYLSINLYC